MKFKLLLISLLSLCVNTLFAQKVEGYFVSRPETDGSVYFLFPQRLFTNEAGEEITYDITVKRGADSVRLNFTYYATEATPIDSARLVSPRVNIGGAVERIYVEPGKSNWTHRYSISGRLEDFYPLYDAAAKPTFTLYAGDKALSPYVAKKRDWEHYAPIGLRIFDMIRLN